MIYEEQLPRAIWTRSFRKHILCGGAGSVGALPERRRAARSGRREGTRRQKWGRDNMAPVKSDESMCFHLPNLRAG